MKKTLFALLSVLLLAGCSQHVPTSAVIAAKPIAEPTLKVADYLAVDCEDIWAVNNRTATDNPLYWLRAVDCAERLSPAAARAEAHRWPAQHWDGAFKQAILLDNGNVTPPERRAYVEQLDSFSASYPGAVRTLLQLWRAQQAAQLELSETRTRYHHLQQASDTQLDQMRQQQYSLHRALAETQHKLERLTDIERQLSNRKSPDLSDRSGVRSSDMVSADESEPEISSQQHEAQK